MDSEEIRVRLECLKLAGGSVSYAQEMMDWLMSTSSVSNRMHESLAAQIAEIRQEALTKDPWAMPFGITPNMALSEVKRLAGPDASFMYGPPLSDSGDLVATVITGEGSAETCFPRGALLLSIDDFSARHLKPAVQIALARRVRGEK